MLKRQVLFRGMLFAIAMLFLSVNAFGAERLYLQNNVHVQSQKSRKGNMVIKASYANYTNPGNGHGIVPVNTPVNISVKRSFRGRGIVIKRLDNGEIINFEYSSRNMRMSMQEYMKVICGSQKVNVGALSKIDRKGIKAGRAFKGMTKKGIRIALGYPAEHRTPSLEDNSWTFWTNRFKTTVVEFNGNGRVASIR